MRDAFARSVGSKHVTAGKAAFRRFFTGGMAKGSVSFAVCDLRLGLASSPDSDSPLAAVVGTALWARFAATATPTAC